MTIKNSAMQWWEQHRPVRWTLQQHLQNPTINCATPAENNLARAVSHSIIRRQKCKDRWVLVKAGGKPVIVGEQFWWDDAGSYALVEMPKARAKTVTLSDRDSSCESETRDVPISELGWRWELRQIQP